MPTPPQPQPQKSLTLTVDDKNYAFDHLPAKIQAAVRTQQKWSQELQVAEGTYDNAREEVNKLRYAVTSINNEIIAMIRASDIKAIEELPAPKKVETAAEGQEDAA